MLVNAEECSAAFQTAIATLIEDASEITLALYVIIGHGEQENIIGLYSYKDYNLRTETCGDLRVLR